jgi:hypothetical protein
MLILSTLKYQQTKGETLGLLENLKALRADLIAKSRRINPNSIKEEAKEMLFDIYMEYSDIVFTPSSKSRVFDYLTSLENEATGLKETESGRMYIALIEAVDTVWKETQAPVAELVGAGKYQLKKVNGAATYHNFSENAKEMPEMFGATKALVDNYLLIDFYAMLIDLAISEGENPPMEYLREVRVQLREFAGRGKAIGFWSDPIAEKSEILKDLNVDSFLVLS